MANQIQNQKRYSLLNNLYFGLALFIVLFEITKHGYLDKLNDIWDIILRFSHLVFSILSFFFARYIVKENKMNIPRFIQYAFLGISIIYVIFSVLLIINPSSNYKINVGVVIMGSFMAFMSIGFKISSLYTGKIHPSLLFVLSFFFLILLGGIALKLPNATVREISFLDALFTSTSAVTVTGLAVLDTNKDYTYFGKIIILILIQLGGIGILTVSNLFYLLFKKQGTFKNRIFVSQMTNEINTANAFNTLYKIVIFTFIIESIGALLIYFSLGNQVENITFFSIFHAVSAFCNAGFSTFTNSLYETGIKYNYPFQLVIAWLIISGGIGYNILINHYNILKNYIITFLNRILNTHFTVKRMAKKTTLNTLIATRTTVFLLVLGTVGFYFLEYENTLQEHSGLWGKLSISFFNSVTTRTAGFNDVDMTVLLTPTILIIMFLMWIGASPGSTGGGIKTTTFAISFMNLINHIKGNKKIIINYRQIASENILLTNAIMLLSFLTIGLGSFLISIFEKGMPYQSILFECISAYSTVGLSLGVTSQFCNASKLVIIILMFVGRVSFLTVLIGIYRQIFKDNPSHSVIYPKENIFIN